MCRPHAGRWACCVGCCPCCGRPFPRRGFSCGSTGALRRRRSSTTWMPSRGSTTWWRWPRTPCCSATPSPPCSWRRPERGQRPDRARLRRHAVPGRHVGPQPPRRDQGRSRPARRPRAARQPALRRDHLRQTPRFVYERIYCARGDIENRIKELLDGLQIDRTSCCRFWANQLRVLVTAAAYVLMQELRLRAARTACARAQVTWLRDRLLKLGAHVAAARHTPRTGARSPVAADSPSFGLLSPQPGNDRASLDAELTSRWTARAPSTGSSGHHHTLDTDPGRT